MNYTIFCGAEGTQIFWFSTYYELNVEAFAIYIYLFIFLMGFMGNVTDYTS
jgi:hypothetical protein